MHIPIQKLAMLLFFPYFLSCQQGSEIAEAQRDYKAVAASLNEPIKTSTNAANIVFKSMDEGKTWQDVSEGLPKDLMVNRVMMNGGKVVLVSETMLYRSNSNSATTVWQSNPFYTILNEPFLDIKMTNIFPGLSGNFASSYEKGFFKEINNSGVWLPMHENLKDKTVRAILETSDGTLFVGCESGLYKSGDSGKSWKQVITGDGINSIAAADGALITGTYKGLFRSIDAGEHWEQIETGDVGAYNIKCIEGAIVSITDAGRWQDGNRDNRLRISTDQGKTWQRIDENLVVPPFMSSSESDASSSLRISDFAQSGKYLFCCTNSGIFRSSDMGKNWELIRLSSSKEMFRLEVSGKVVYAVQVVGC